MPRKILKQKAISLGKQYKTSNLLDDIDGMTNELYDINNGVSTSLFNTYTGTTVPNNFYNKTQINAYTGNTNQHLLNIDNKINQLSGNTNYVNNTTFNTYTGNTNNTLYNKLETSLFNTYTGNTSSLNNFYINRTNENFILANGLLFDRILTEYNLYTLIGNDKIISNQTDIKNNAAATIIINGIFNNIDLTDFNAIDNDLSDFNLTEAKANHLVFQRLIDNIYWKLLKQENIIIVDITAPIYSNVSVDQITQTAFRFNAQLNETGRIYWGLYTNNSASPNKTQITGGTGTGIIQYSNILVSSGITLHQTISGLTLNTSYDLYHYAVDTYANETAIQTKIDVSTLSIIQLTTPTNGTPTVNSQTQITANVSDVDVNASYLRLEYKATSSGTWLVYSSTLPRSTTSQAIGSLSPNTSYDFRWTALGDGVYYSNSSVSTTQTASTSNLPQLSAPTAGSFSNVTQTAFRIAVSGVDANAYGLDIFIGGVKYGATLSRIVTYVDVTGLTANTNYSVYFVAKGDGVNYLDSNNSNTVSQTTLANQPPSFASASITGSAIENQILTAVAGTYTPNTEGGAQGPSLFQWLVCDTVGGTYTNISGATSSTYTILNANVNKFIKVDITPTATSGTTPGTAVRSAATSQVQADIVMPTGLVTHYKMDGNANDEFGIYNGTVVGATLANDRNSNPNSAYYYGLNNYINIGNAGDFTNNFTICGWFKKELTNSAGTHLISKRGGTTQYQYHIATTQELYTGSVYVAGTSLGDTNWHFGALVVNGASSFFYLDGAQDGATFNPTITSRPTVNANIGGWGNGSAAVFRGWNNDIRIYNRALSLAELSVLYNL